MSCFVSGTHGAAIDDKDFASECLCLKFVYVRYFVIFMLFVCD